MTPLRGLFRKLKGETTPALDAPQTGEAPRRGQQPAVAKPALGGGPILTDEPSKRRRGRRGGRNRRRDGDGAQTGSAEARSNGAAPTGERAARDQRNGTRSEGRRSETPSTSSSTSTSRTRTRTRSERSGRSAESRSNEGRTTSGKDSPKQGDGYAWGRRVDPNEADERSRRANRRRRDVRARNLDAPLPEDIAFRPGGEGGDSTILPSRRRKPTGLHDTARVLVGGARTLGAWVKRDERHGIEPTPPREDEPLDDVQADRPRALLETAVAHPVREPEPAEADLPEADDAVEEHDDTDAETETGEPRKRRRRGRRGGRGRRRTEGAPTDTDGYEDQPEASDDEDDGDDEDEVLPADEEDEDDADEVVAERRRSPRRRSRAAERAPLSDEELPAAFAALGVNRKSLEALARFGFQEPTPIQSEAIPALLNGLDVVGIAQTGSGKTVAFGVPMVERLDSGLPEVQGIVLVPTRELAQQVLDVLGDLAEPWGLEAVGLLGGRSLKADFRALEGRPHVVVGTPGRILDHLRRQTLSLRHVRYAVLDEADQMLDIGFLPDIRRILSRTPQRRQTALFSATMPGSIKRLIWQFMTDPETVRVDAEATTVDTIQQVYFEVANRDKVRATRELIERELKGRTLIFCNMKRGVDHLARELDRDGVRVGALHGDMDQRRRDGVVRDFRAGSLDVLIATNVAARGLDIPEITHVVNYDVPQNLEEYVHRIGRTGRAGRDGKAITFVSEWDVDAFDAIRNEVGVDVERQELDLYAPRAAAPAVSDRDAADPAG